MNEDLKTACWILGAVLWFLLVLIPVTIKNKISYKPTINFTVFLVTLVIVVVMILILGE